MIDKIKVIDNFLSNEDFDLILKIADKIDIGPSNKIVLSNLDIFIINLLVIG